MVTSPFLRRGGEPRYCRLENGTGGNSDDEKLEGNVEGSEGVRLYLDKDDEAIKELGDPRIPSEEEVKSHSLTGHIPYRNWCRICVKSQGRDFQHVRDKGKERRLPEYSWDYCFPGDELGFKWTVLVGKERQSKMWMAVAVSHKGGSGIRIDS